MGGFSRVKKKHYRYTKKSSGRGGGGSSGDSLLIVLALFLGFIAVAAKALLIALPIIIIGAIIYASVSSAEQAQQAKVAEEERIKREKEAEEERKRQEEIRKEREKRESLAWIQRPEPVYKERLLPKSYGFTKEEKRVSDGYIEYLKEKDTAERLKKHIDWIDKYNQICRKYSVEDKNDYSSDRTKAYADMGAANRRASQAAYSTLCPPNEKNYSVKYAYENLQRALKWAERDKYNYDDEAYGYFRKEDAIETDSYPSDIYFITPWYVFGRARDYGEQGTLELIRYEDVKIEMWCDEVISHFTTSLDDIARVKWEHEKKDGGPDLRYADNTKTTYVYKGRVKLTFSESIYGKHEATLKFYNRRNAKDFFDAWQSYASLLKKRENSPIVNAVLNNTAKTLDEYYEKKQKRKASREKTKAKKEEYANELKPGSVMTHKALGKCTLVSIKDGYMTVEFPDGQKKFKFPNAIKDGFFSLG